MQNNNDKGKHFSEQYPQIYRALEVLETKCQDGKHLDPKMLLLIKLAVTAGLYFENTVKAHTAKALAMGIAEEQIEEAILSNLSTVGYPKTVSALNWVRAITGKTPFS